MLLLKIMIKLNLANFVATNMLKIGLYLHICKYSPEKLL